MACLYMVHLVYINSLDLRFLDTRKYGMAGIISKKSSLNVIMRQLHSCVSQSSVHAGVMWHYSTIPSQLVNKNEILQILFHMECYPPHTFTVNISTKQKCCCSHKHVQLCLLFLREQNKPLFTGLLVSVRHTNPAHTHTLVCSV